MDETTKPLCGDWALTIPLPPASQMNPTNSASTALLEEFVTEAGFVSKNSTSCGPLPLSLLQEQSSHFARQ
jgi:hypothetical protein